jgi:hypothetical protein
MDLIPVYAPTSGGLLSECDLINESVVLAAVIDADCHQLAAMAFAAEQYRQLQSHYCWSSSEPSAMSSGPSGDVGMGADPGGVVRVEDDPFSRRWGRLLYCTHQCPTSRTDQRTCYKRARAIQVCSRVVSSAHRSRLIKCIELLKPGRFCI